ncbi:hypothetical protein U3A55_00225, partial [Salarchaeum sp. III]
FPQTSSGDMLIGELWTKYREQMLTNVGISIFIFGNKIDENTGKVMEANGMKEEFDISIKNGAIPIPVGATGFTAFDLWEQVINDFSNFVGKDTLYPLYESLGDNSKTGEELIELVIKIIKELTKYY